MKQKLRFRKVVENSESEYNLLIGITLFLLGLLVVFFTIKNMQGHIYGALFLIDGMITAFVGIGFICFYFINREVYWEEQCD